MLRAINIPMYIHSTPIDTWHIGIVQPHVDGMCRMRCTITGVLDESMSMCEIEEERVRHVGVDASVDGEMLPVCLCLCV